MYVFVLFSVVFFFFKQKTAYELRISDWSSDVCSSDLGEPGGDRLDSLGLTRRNPAGEPATATRTRANGQRNDPGRDRTDHRGAGARRPVGDLDRQVVRQAYRVDRRFGLGRARRSGRAARPQRRGQDDVLLFGDGAGEARFGPRAARWRGYHRAADVPPRNPGARLSAAGNVDLSWSHDREEHTDRARTRRAR